MDGQARLSSILRVAIGCTVVAALAFPAAAPAAISQSDYKNASKFCKALKVDMGATLFKTTYGTKKNNSNAHGKCVSKHARTVDRLDRSAREACQAERALDAAAFQAKYGTGKKGRNAFGKCVSSKARTLKSEEQDGIEKAARSCRDERKSIGSEAFANKYGTNANKRNAFGKCVSQHAKDAPAPS